MADNIIHLDEPGRENQQNQAEGAQSPKQNKILNKIQDLKNAAFASTKNKIISASIAGGVLLIIVLILILSGGGQKPQEEAAAKFSPPPMPRPVIEPLAITRPPAQKHTELDNMITKANILYAEGAKLDALNLFEHIALFSQSIASYNLGVIKLKEKDYQNAITLFDSSINTGEDVSIAALNAAYAAYAMGDYKLHDYYAGVAAGRVMDTVRLPIYSYLYGLLRYYQGGYFEALSPFVNPSSPAYKVQSARMAAQIFLVFNDDYNALKHLKMTADKNDNLSMGLLYARLGEYDNARRHIREFLAIYPNHTQALMALQLVELKLRNYADAAKILENVVVRHKNTDALLHYPIKVRLRDDLFDVNLAQMRFWESRFSSNHMLPYKLFFYYAPFKIFDATDALRIIQEGQLHARFDNLEVARDTLIEGQRISNINENISKGLRALIGHDVRGALKFMKESLKIYPNHYALHYNLGLIYAQTGDFDNAYTHFLRAYHLNNNDALSGIFAVMAGRITFRDVNRILHQISNDFDDLRFDSELHKNFMLSLLQYANGQNFDPNFIERMGVSKTKIKARPMFYALAAAYGIASGNKEEIIEAFGALKEQYPTDIVANVMYRLALNYKSDIKAVALAINQELKAKDLNLDSVYYGASIARELFVYIAFVTGNLKNIQNELEARLVSEIEAPAGVLQALALSYIYSNDFERAFVLYNSLIDDLKESDSNTKFLAAIAAIGAGHPENAALLLQLANLESSSNYEGRYGLALLYQEIKNIRPAISHLERIAHRNFRSEYFDFEIDTHAIVGE